MRIVPCATLMTRITPNTKDSPSATRAYSPPTSKPDTTTCRTMVPVMCTCIGNLGEMRSQGVSKLGDPYRLPVTRHRLFQGGVGNDGLPSETLDGQTVTFLPFFH